MTVYFLRRLKLGRTSTREIIRYMETPATIIRHDRDRIPISTSDTCIRWGCTATVPTSHVINKASAIHTVNNKSNFRRLLQTELPEITPGTIWSPRDSSGPHPDAPLIVRPERHAQGRKLYVCHNRHELEAAFTRCGHNAYASQFIPKVAEYRVFMAQGRTICVAQKTPSNPMDVAWNVARGGRFDNVRWDEWPLRAIKDSIAAFNLSDLDFGGVDVMVDNDGRSWILEINSAPSMTSEYRQRCFAKIFDWILIHPNKIYPLTEQRGGYTKFIHPALSNKAIV